MNQNVRTVILFILAVSIFGLYSCTSPLISYHSTYGERQVLPTKAKLDVIIEDKDLCSELRNEESKLSIVQSIQSDLSRNLLNLTSLEDHEIHVKVFINLLDYREEPWGFIWRPLWWLGAPQGKVVGEAILSLTINRKDDSMIVSYTPDKIIVSHWHGLYYGQQYLLSSKKGGVINEALRLAMEDIKDEVIQDKDKIVAMIGQTEVVKLPQRNASTVSYPSFSGDRLSIAVLELKALGVSQITASILTETVREELFKTQRFRITNRADMVEIMGEQAFAQSGACGDTQCIIEYGKILGVEKMIGGSISKLGKMYSITLKLVNVTTAENEKIISDRKRVIEEEFFSLAESAVS